MYTCGYVGIKSPCLADATWEAWPQVAAKPHQYVAGCDDHIGHLIGEALLKTTQTAWMVSRIEL